MLSIEYNTTNIDFNKEKNIKSIGEGSSAKMYKFDTNQYVIKILKNNHRLEYDFYKHFLNRLLQFEINTKFGYPVAYGNIRESFDDFTNNNKFLILNFYKKLDILLMKGETISDKVFNFVRLAEERVWERQVNAVRMRGLGARVKMMFRDQYSSILGTAADSAAGAAFRFQPVDGRYDPFGRGHLDADQSCCWYDM